MPDCHKCPRNGQPDERCLDCARHDIATETSFQRSKHNTVSRDGLAEDGYDPAKVTITPAMLAAADEREGEDEGIGDLPPGAIAPLLDFLHQLLRLDFREWLVVGLRFESLRTPDGSPSYAQIGAEVAARTAAPEALSKQEVKEILANAVSKTPALDALFPGLAQRRAQQARGRGVDAGMGVQGFLGL